MDPRSDQFLTLLTSSQTSLYAYILSLLPDRAAAQDILQEVNLTVWHKAADFREGTGFFAWASKIAYFHVLSHRRKMSRDKLVFAEDVLDYLAERHAERLEQHDAREQALRECLNELPAKQRSLVEERYAPGGSVQVIAAKAGRSVGAISQNLYRIREVLLACIEGKLKSGEAA